MTGTQTIQISEATYDALMEEIRSRGLSIEEWIWLHLPNGSAEQNGHAPETEETIGERLERKGLIGVIDSSQPIDPSSPPVRTPFFEIIAEKLRKQGLIIP
jgi:hypothetical protein